MTDKNTFYQSTYPTLLKALTLSTALSLLVLCLLGYRLLYPPKTDYFAVMPDNKVQRVVALDYPVVSRGEIIRWANQAVISIYNYGFNDWERQLDKASDYFTSTGYNSFRRALTQNGVLTNVIEQKLQVTAVVTGPPVIIAEGVMAGRYSWKVNMPVLLTYLSSSTADQKKLVVSLLISRVDVVDNPRGYAIAQFFES